MSSLRIQIDQRQSHSLSPRLQHAVRLLQMSSLDFAALVRDAACSNPFLDVEDGDGDAADDAAGPDSALQQLPTADEADSVSALPETHAGDGDRDGDGDNDRDMWLADGSSGLRRTDDDDMSAMEMMAVETSLSSHLHDQVNVLRLSERDRVLARTIVDSLDEDGYLRVALDELLTVAALDPVATLQEMETALKRIQALDPAGVGARSVGECLRLQLGSIACPRMRERARTIVDEHLDALAARDIPSMARHLGAPAAEVEAVCDRIRRLDPRPGWRHGSSQAAYVVPDVVARKQRGQWVVQLNPAIVPRIRFNQVYAQLFQRHRSAEHVEMGSHLQEARWTLHNVEQRFSTILDVATAIVQRQRSFFDFGPMAMKPMGLKEIADAVGIHESTVSRVTNNKFIATPNGVFELKYFFSRAMISVNGSACSGTAIRGLIHDIILAENGDAPLSDAEITRQLAEQGLVLARRTVTKYRQMLKIEAVNRRRRHG